MEEVIIKIAPQMLENVLCSAIERSVLCRDTDGAHTEYNKQVLLINILRFILLYYLFHVVLIQAKLVEISWTPI
jgi:hypothetical protein